LVHEGERNLPKIVTQYCFFNYSSVLVYVFYFVLLFFVVSVLPSGVIKNDMNSVTAENRTCNLFNASPTPYLSIRLELNHVTLYQTYIVLVLMYGCETWAITK